MRTMMILPALALIAGAAACGGGEEAHDVDAEACEHLQGGPNTAVTASAMRDASAPRVSASHMAYTVSLPTAAVGYLAFPATAAVDYAVFVDLPLPFEVFDAAGAKVTLEESVASSPACATIKGKHTVALPVGTAYFALGPVMGGMVKLVVEDAGDHEH